MPIMRVSDPTFEGKRSSDNRVFVRFRVNRAPDQSWINTFKGHASSSVLRAAAGNHEAAIEELRGCALDDPAFGGENPAMLAWRSAAALSLAERGRHSEARALAADELRRAQSFGAPRAIGIALRAKALVGPPADRLDGLAAAVDVLAQSRARLEHARVLLDLGAARRAAGQRSAAREPLLEALALTARCGAKALERRARAELAAIGLRPRTTDRSGARVQCMTPCGTRNPCPGRSSTVRLSRSMRNRPSTT